MVSEPEGNRSFELTQLMSRRGGGEWARGALKRRTRQAGLLVPSPSEYHFFTPDLTESLVEPTEPSPGRVGGVTEHPPLSSEASEKTMYVRHDGSGGTGFVPLVTAGNDTAHTAFGGGLEFLDATPDLCARDPGIEGRSDLCCAVGGRAVRVGAATRSLQLVSVLPDGTPAPDGNSESASRNRSWATGGGLNARNAISADGSRVFWSEESRQVPEDLYLRDSATGETIKVNAAQGHGATEPGPGAGEVPEPSKGTGSALPDRVQ